MIELADNWKRAPRIARPELRDVVGDATRLGRRHAKGGHAKGGHAKGGHAKGGHAEGGHAKGGS